MDLTENDIRLLLRAAKRPLTAIYPDTLAAAAALTNAGYLRSLDEGCYALTTRGRHALMVAQFAAEEAAAVISSIDMSEPAHQGSPTPAQSEIQNCCFACSSNKPKKTFRQLRERQRVMLRFIEIYIAENGIAPTRREMGDELKISTSVVNYNLDQLIEWGYLERVDSASRGLRLVVDLPGSSVANSAR